MKKNILPQIFLVVHMFFVFGCRQLRTPQEPVESVVYPTPADNLSELIDNLSSDDMLVRLVSIRALSEYGPEAAVAVPSLVLNLYEDPSDIRRAAAIELGLIGPDASEAVQELIEVLEKDDAYQVRVSAAEALGEIGSQIAVPFLADCVFSTQDLSNSLVISCAKSIALITGEDFTDVDGDGYTLNKEGIPLLVADAREWWETTGREQDWDTGE